MMRFAEARIPAAMFLLCVLGSTGAVAQELQAPTLLKSADEAAASASVGPSTPAQPATALLEQRRPATLIPMYVSFSTLQILDAKSTLDVVGRGGAEANPVMKGVAGNPVALFAVKAAGTTGVIFAAEKMWKKNKPAAVIFMLAANSAMAWVVNHNYRAGHD
jgi:hypothetical protein